MTDLAINLNRVSKTYRRRVHALRGVSMHVRRGEVFGLLGPNGAGKSTLVKILMTVISASECQGTMLGKPIGDKRTLGRVGYLPEHHRFPDYLTARQVLEYFAALAGMPRADRKRRSSELLSTVGLSAWADKRVREFSKGMRQRVGVAQALMTDPDIVMLDEPTDGVDPLGRRDIREVLLAEKAKGRTVFLNSHLLSELEMVCDRVAIMVRGEVKAQGTIDELTAYGRRYEIEVSGLPASESLERLAKAALPASVTIEMNAATALIGTSDEAVVQPIIDAVRACGGLIKTCRAIRPSLEDLFMRAVTDPETGQAFEPGAAGMGYSRGGAA